MVGIAVMATGVLYWACWRIVPKWFGYDFVPRKEKLADGTVVTVVCLVRFDSPSALNRMDLKASPCFCSSRPRSLTRCRPRTVAIGFIVDERKTRDPRISSIVTWTINHSLTEVIWGCYACVKKRYPERTIGLEGLDFALNQLAFECDKTNV